MFSTVSFHLLCILSVIDDCPSGLHLGPRIHQFFPEALEVSVIMVLFIVFFFNKPVFTVATMQELRALNQPTSSYHHCQIKHQGPLFPSHLGSSYGFYIQDLPQCLNEKAQTFLFPWATALADLLSLVVKVKPLVLFSLHLHNNWLTEL